MELRDPGHRAAADERPPGRGPAHAGGAGHRRGDPGPAVDHRRAGGAGLAPRPHRLHPRPLGPRGRERGPPGLVAGEGGRGSRSARPRARARSPSRRTPPTMGSRSKRRTAGCAVPTHRAEPRSPPIRPTGIGWWTLSPSSPRSRSRPASPPRSSRRAPSIRFGDVRLDVLHTPGHTEGSVCLVDRGSGILFSGDTLFTGGWGRVDLPGGDPDAMVASLARLATLPDGLRVLPGHGSATTIARERAWLEMVAREWRLPL